MMFELLKHFLKALVIVYSPILGKDTIKDSKDNIDFVKESEKNA